MAQPQLHVARDDLESLTREVRRLADLVGLRGHTFEVQRGQLPAGIAATCTCLPGRAYSVVTIGDAFWQLDPPGRHNALVHEVLHPILHPLMEHIEDVQAELSRRHWETLERIFRRDLERAIDTLATAIAPLIE